MSSPSAENPLQTIEPSDARFSLGTLLGAMTAVAIVAAIAGTIVRYVAADTRERLVTFWGIWLAGSIVFAVFAMQQRRTAEQRAGRTLLKLPMWPNAHSSTWLNWQNASSLFFALLMLPLASLLLAENPATATGTDWLMHYALPTMYAFFVTASLIPRLLWSHHVRFCEYGILADRKVLFWREVLEHRFKGEHVPKLELRSANDIHNHPWLTFTIERDQVGTIEELIAEKTSNAPKVPTGVPVSLSQAPVTEIFQYVHLRNHLLCAAVSVAFGGWLFFMGLVNSPGNREFQDIFFFAIYAWLFLQGWRFRWFLRNSGAPIRRIFGRRDLLGFAANVSRRSACTMPISISFGRFGGWGISLAPRSCFLQSTRHRITS